MATMQSKKHWRSFKGSEPEMAKLAPEYPSVQTLLGSLDEEILKIAEQVYRGELAVATSVLPHKQQDECMRELCHELTRCMTRASLQSETKMTQSFLKGWRHFHSDFFQQTCFPSAGIWAMEVANWLKEDALTGQLEVRRHSHSMGRDRSRWHQHPSLQFPSRCQWPCPSPPQACLADKHLSHSMKNLNLQTRPCEFRSRVWWHDALTPAK